MAEGTTVLPIKTNPGTSGGPKRDGFVLGQRASLVVSAGVAGHTLWASAAPALTYRLYAQEWHLTYAATTGIFAVFPIAVVAMLVGLGGVSDQIGRRAAMLVGLGASLVGAVLFAGAPDVCWVLAGRALMGIGVGLTAAPSTAAILEFSRHQDATHAASLTTMAQAGGFTAALLLGGALTEYGPWPTRLCFWVLAVLLGALTIATWFLPRHTNDDARADDAKRGWRSRMPFVPKHMRRAFATASAAMIAAYTFGVLVLSLGGQVEHDLLGSSNALLNGAAMALFPIVLGPFGIVAKGLSPRIALSIGAVAAVLGMGLLALAVGRHDLLIYFLATATAGASYSLMFVGSLQLINVAAPPHHRGGVLSALYLVGYLSMGALALVLGVVATFRGLEPAVDLGAAAISFVSLVALVLAIAAHGPAPSSLASADTSSANDRSAVP
jgi:predicted MFS family arabinose efflux permease